MSGKLHSYDSVPTSDEKCNANNENNVLPEQEELLHRKQEPREPLENQSEIRKTSIAPNSPEKIYKGGLGVRHVQAIMLFLGISLSFALRVNLSVGIVAMTDNTTNPEMAKVNWSTAERGILLGSFFWGYVLTQLPSGLISEKVGPAVPMGATMLFSGLTTLLLPLAATKGGFLMACFARVMHGLSQGFVFPCTQNLMSKWAIPQERGRMAALVFGGSQFGSITMMIAGGYIAASPLGWPSIFYVSGALAIVWGIACFLIVRDSPQKHKGISAGERLYMESNMPNTTDSSAIPKIAWKDLVKSVPLAALAVAHMAQNWGFWTLLTLIPTYLSSVMGFDIKQNGFLSALPYIVMWVVSFPTAFLADYLIKRGIFTTGFSRKFWNSVALYGGGAALAMLAFLDTDATGAIVLLTVALGLNCGTYSGYYLNHIDLAPNFAGTLMGITNGLANVMSILGPTLAGLIVTEEGNASQWQTVFLISAAIFITGQTIFNIFGSAETQSWNEGRPRKEKNPESGVSETIKRYNQRLTRSTL